MLIMTFNVMTFVNVTLSIMKRIIMTQHFFHYIVM
jgi:hypothetical protein